LGAGVQAGHVACLALVCSHALLRGQSAPEYLVELLLVQSYCLAAAPRGVQWLKQTIVSRHDPRGVAVPQAALGQGPIADVVLLVDLELAAALLLVGWQVAGEARTEAKLGEPGVLECAVAPD